MDALTTQEISTKIYEIRGVKVMLDSDLAALYQVKTFRLNEQFKRNIDRFPQEFAFQLTKQEWENLRSQNAISSWGGRRYLPYVFTEYGTLALSSILKSDIAVRVNKLIIKTFVELRRQITTNPSYELLKEKVRRIESEFAEYKLTQGVENNIVTNKLTQLSRKVNHISNILDEFQDTHLIIKRPDSDKQDG